MKGTVLYAAIVVALLGWCAPGLTPPAEALISLEKCTLCHGKPEFRKILVDGKIRDLFATADSMKGSVHEKKTCVDCHFDISEIPHRERPHRVTCTHCHYKGNAEGAPQSDGYLAYFESVHGKAIAGGNAKAPLCQDCHGSHFILKAKNETSLVSQGNVAETCGRCHIEIYAKYRMSIHGVAVAKGIKEAPSCTGCHGEHKIYGPKNPKSTVYATHVAEQCSKCHGSVSIMSKFGIETEQVATYKESFHGVASQFGSRTVANCASCHGTHEIRPEADPLSSVNPKNVPRTCGKCHPGANPNFAVGKMHVDAKKKEAGIVYYVASFFKYLTIGTMLALIVHILLDMYGRTKRLRGEK
jgi:DnaJ-class molecular chaperone